MTEIERIDAAIKYFGYKITTLDKKPRQNVHAVSVHYETALSALREKRERMRPEALSIKELHDKRRSGDPLWLNIVHCNIAKWAFLVTIWKNERGENMFVFWDYVEERALNSSTYGKTWLAYAVRPEEEAK